MAWQLVRHAFAMIFGNLGQALKVSLIPYGILVATVLTSFALMGLPVSMSPTVLPETYSPYAIFLLIPLAIFAIFVFGWVAVSWHRFILKEEYTALVPVYKNRPIWSYVGQSMWLGLIVSLAAIPVFLLTSLIAAPFAGSGSLLVPLLALFCGLTALAYLWMRWAIALPATAIGSGMTMSEAWAATAPMSKTIFGVALILMGINVLPAYILGNFYAAGSLVGVVLDVFLQWLTIMLGLSILTTLYGHLIEKRPL
ncbi:hypothetical protein [Yoonia sp. MH D7]